MMTRSEVATARRPAYNGRQRPGARGREGHPGGIGLGDNATATRRLIFLGSGTSTGVPVIGCDCQVCTSGDPRNQRTRPSVLIQNPAANVLIDTPPEMRLQLLREKVGRVHAIIYTHYH